ESSANVFEARLQGLDFTVNLLRALMVFLAPRSAPDLDDAGIRLDPALRAVDREKDGLELVVLLVADRLELVRVAAGALNRDAKQGAHDVLEIPFQDTQAVGADLVGIAVAFSRAVG